MTSKPTKPRRLLTPVRTVILLPLVLLALGIVFRPVVLTQLQLGQHHCYFTQSQFSLSWQHSVEKQPWLERYQRQANGFLLLDTQFKTFGAGTPDQGTPLAAPDGYVRFDVQQHLSELNWMVSANVQSTLLLDTQPIALYLWNSGYNNAHFEVQRWPWWKTRLKDSCDDYTL